MVTLPITDELPLDTASVGVMEEGGILLLLALQAGAEVSPGILSTPGYRNPANFSLWSEDLNNRFVRGYVNMGGLGIA